MSIRLKCDKCGKEIEGLTKSQADYNMKAHQLGKKCKTPENINATN